MSRGVGLVPGHRAAPRRGILTNMHLDLDYATVDAETPAHITPAHDGLTLTLPAPD